jgi:arylsulfatase A-like enzyme
LDGVNLLPYLTREKTEPPHDALYWRMGEQMAVRVGDYKLVRYDGEADAVGDEPKRPVSEARLYNLAEDVGETRDLAATMPDKLAELQSKWDAWNATLAAPLWTAKKAARKRPATGAAKNARVPQEDSVLRSRRGSTHREAARPARTDPTRATLRRSTGR